MEAPDIASTEIGTVHMEDVEVHNGEASPATGDSAVEYIFTAGAPSFAHLKSRYGGRRIPHRSALLASALALAASITVFLVWSALCELPSSKTATVGLVKRRLSYGQAYGQYGYTLSNTEQSCAVLETNLKAIQNALWPDKEPAQKKLRLTADEYGPGARTTEETPWLQPLRGASCWSSSACSEASSSLLTSGLKQLSSPESELESLPWTGLPTNEDIQLQGNPFARMPEFDAMPTRSWPACEQRETQNTTLLSEAAC